ncbi:MAG: DEAD/DEAH box helicase family protein [bacterium]|nr:DEAD/DEAH box helicase family protein [bacterium]
MTFLSAELMKGTDWFGLERSVGRLMSHCGWKDVRIVGASGDGGADVLAVREIAGKRHIYVVQVKAVTGDNYVGPVALEEVISAMSAYRGDVGIVATNGDFTRSARKRREELRAAGFLIELWNGLSLKKLIEQWPLESQEKRKLREYQSDILSKCLEQYGAGGQKGYFIVATGLGKTVIAAELVARLRESGLSSALVLCHSQELAAQLEQNFWTQLGSDTATRLFYDGEPPKPFDGVNFGLYQTFVSYLSGIEQHDFDILIVDEAHHALAHGFRRCIKHLRPKYLLGMTATPWRGDGASIGEVFGSSVGAVSLVDGMKMGYLAEVDYRIYTDTVDWETVGRLTKGQLSIKDLNTQLFIPQRDEAVIERIVDECSEVAAPHILIFCASVEHCRRFASLLCGRSKIECKQLSGLDRIGRNRTLMEFASGRIQAVTAVDVLNEGIDVPAVNILVFLRGTHSRRIFVQQLGRGLRIAPGKDKVIVLDFVTDIRRIAAALDMDREARQAGSKYQSVYFPQGIVRFRNPEFLPFVTRWLEDVAGLDDRDESHILSFPV